MPKRPIPAAPAGYPSAGRQRLTVPFEGRGHVCPTEAGAMHGRRGWTRCPVTGDLERTCPKCGESWPADTEFWVRRALGQGGLFPRCKACYAEYRAGRHRPGPVTRARARADARAPTTQEHAHA